MARRIVETHEAGHPVVAVVSARGDTTDELVELAHEITATHKIARWTCCCLPGTHIGCPRHHGHQRTGLRRHSLTGPQAEYLDGYRPRRAQIVDLKRTGEGGLGQRAGVLVAAFRAYQWPTM